MQSNSVILEILVFLFDVQRKAKRKRQRYRKEKTCECFNSGGGRTFWKGECSCTATLVKDGAAAPLIPPIQNHPPLRTEIGQLAKCCSPQLPRNIK